MWEDTGAAGPSKRFGATAEEDELMDLTILNDTRPVREWEPGNKVPLVTAQILAKMPTGTANETVLAHARHQARLS